MITPLLIAPVHYQPLLDYFGHFLWHAVSSQNVLEGVGVGGKWELEGWGVVVFKLYCR